MLFLPVKLLIRSDETGADVVSQEGSDPFLFQNREARSVLNSSRSYSGPKISSTLLVPMALFGRWMTEECGLILDQARLYK